MNVITRFGVFLLIFCKLFAVSAQYNKGVCKIYETKLVYTNKRVTRTRMSQKLNCVNVWSNYCHYVPHLITESTLNSALKEVEVPKNVCCAGYEEKPHYLLTLSESSQTPICKPKCTNGCVNGKCVEPEICECNEGYEFETNHTCKPTCKHGCSNGICVGVNRCKCLPNYVYKNESMCQPYCIKPCINATCTKPFTCDCLPRYTKTEDHVCEPECELKCINGKCTDINKCGCDDGYKLRENTWHLCDPICLECQNGYCASPNNCTCFEGYETDIEKPEVCNPICNETCINGFCSEPDICSCNEGYALRTNESNVCEPICENGCEQGFCVEPNVCECFPNYIPETLNKCVPYCENGCINGECAKPSYCQCYLGTIKVNSSYCVDVCDGNTTEECYHVAQTLQEHTINLLDNEIILFPKNRHILTLKSSCVKNITFDCMLDKLDDELYGTCQVQNDTQIQIEPQHESNFTSFNQTYTANVNLTFIYEKENTTELCKFCFCDNYNMEVNTGYFYAIALCPCQDIIQTNKLQANNVSVLQILTILVCSILAITLGIVAFIIRKKKLEGDYRIGTNMQDSALIEEEL